MDCSTSSSGLLPPSSHQDSDHAAVCGQGLVLPACGWQIIQKTDLYNNTSHLHSAWMTTFCKLVYECSWVISTLLCHVDTEVLTHASPWGVGYHYHCWFSLEFQKDLRMISVIKASATAAASCFDIGKNSTRLEKLQNVSPSLGVNSTRSIYKWSHWFCGGGCAAWITLMPLLVFIFIFYWFY